MSFETLFSMVVLAAVTVIVAVGIFSRSNKKKYRTRENDNSYLTNDSESDTRDSISDDADGCDSCADCDCGGDD